jgi:hypothetical protein
MTVSKLMAVSVIMVIIILKLIQSSGVGIDASESGCSDGL